MEISQTTHNYAKARGLELTVEEHVLYVWEIDNDCEWLFTLYVLNRGFAWRANVRLQQSIKEELPAFMDNEKSLRKVLDFVAKERAKLV